MILQLYCSFFKKYVKKKKIKFHKLIYYFVKEDKKALMILFSEN